jgi:hypothetical protein
MKETHLIILACICLLSGSTYAIGYELGGETEREIRDDMLNTFYEADFIFAAKQLARENEYDVDTYNCVNFSNALVNRLDELGYEAKVVTGWLSREEYCEVGNESYIKGIPLATAKENDCIGAHAWVEVTIPIEATSGRIIK